MLLLLVLFMHEDIPVLHKYELIPFAPSVAKYRVIHELSSAFIFRISFQRCSTADLTITLFTYFAWRSCLMWHNNTTQHNNLLYDVVLFCVLCLTALRTCKCALYPADEKHHFGLGIAWQADAEQTGFVSKSQCPAITVFPSWAGLADRLNKLILYSMKKINSFLWEGNYPPVRSNYIKYELNKAVTIVSH